MVHLFRETDTLRPESRVNFRDITPIYYSPKIKFIGRVSAESIRYLRAYLPDSRPPTQELESSDRYLRSKQLSRHVLDLSERHIMHDPYHTGQYPEGQHSQAQYRQEKHKSDQDPDAFTHVRCEELPGPNDSDEGHVEIRMMHRPTMPNNRKTAKSLNIQDVNPEEKAVKPVRREPNREQKFRTMSVQKYGTACNSCLMSHRMVCLPYLAYDAQKCRLKRHCVVVRPFSTG